MAYELVIAPAAEFQLQQAVYWHEEQEAGLGEKLNADVREKFLQILQNPLIYRIRTRRLRSARLKQFSAYAIYFRVTDEKIVVYSFFHASRNPSDLKKNLP